MLSPGTHPTDGANGVPNAPSTVTIRVHHDGVSSVSLDASEDLFSVTSDFDSDELLYRGCFAVMPMVSVDSGYPGNMSDGLQAGESYPDFNGFPNGTRRVIHFDNVVVDTDARAVTVPWSILQVANGWLSGMENGSMGEGVTLSGSLTNNVTSNGADYQAYDRFDNRGTPGRALDHPWQYGSNDNIMATFWSNGATYVDMGGLSVRQFNGDANDIMCAFGESFGSQLPNCNDYGYNYGTGLLFDGIINSNMENAVSRKFDHGLVIGNGTHPGSAIFYEHVYNGQSQYPAGARGLDLTGGVIEGNSYTQTIDWGSDRRNNISDVHFESGDGGSWIGGQIVKPDSCIESSTTGLITRNPNTPYTDEYSCLARFPVTSLTFPTATTAEVHIPITGADTTPYDSMTTDDLVVLQLTGSGLDKVEFPILFIQDVTTHMQIVVDTTGTAHGTIVDATPAASDKDHAVSFINAGADKGNIRSTPSSLFGDFTISGRVTASGNSNHGETTTGTPAWFIGRAFGLGHTLRFTDGVQVGVSFDERALPASTFVFDRAETYFLPDDTDNGHLAHGIINTSGAQVRYRMPKEFYGWRDDREVQVGEFTLRSGGWGGAYPTNQSIDAAEMNFATTPVASNTANALAVMGSPYKLDFTRAEITVLSDFTGEESCRMDFGFGSNNSMFTLQVPEAASQGQGHVFGNRVTAIEAPTADPGPFGVEISDGDFSQTQIAPSCTGIFAVKVKVFGFPGVQLF
jgi:hypothetical protein